MDLSAFKLLITPEDIAVKVRDTAIQIESDYQGKDLVIIMVLKGAVCIVADLIREIRIPFSIESVQCSSYGENGVKRGALQMVGIERLSVQNRDVLIVDDIFDSGHTMISLMHALQQLHPRTLKTCVLLNKQGIEKITDYVPDYVLFDIDNSFVVGYGLDFKELYRGLPGIYKMDGQ